MKATVIRCDRCGIEERIERPLGQGLAEDLEGWANVFAVEVTPVETFPAGSRYEHRYEHVCPNCLTASEQDAFAVPVDEDIPF